MHFFLFIVLTLSMIVPEYVFDIALVFVIGNLQISATEFSQLWVLSIVHGTIAIV